MHLISEMGTLKTSKYCSTVRNKHWAFDPRLADVVNQFAHVLIRDQMIFT